jgi:hypothetical protein
LNCKFALSVVICWLSVAGCSLFFVLCSPVLSSSVLRFSSTCPLLRRRATIALYPRIRLW